MAIYDDRVCCVCATVFSGGPGARYCPPCRAERKKVTTKQYVQRKRSGKSRSLGSSDICQMCGAVYVVTGGSQRVCTDCADERRKVHDRKRALERYALYKHIINPARMLRRRKPDRPCAICGTLHRATTGVTCGARECRKKYYNNWTLVWIRETDAGKAHAKRHAEQNKERYDAMNDEQREKLNARARENYHARKNPNSSVARRARRQPDVKSKESVEAKPQDVPENKG